MSTLFLIRLGTASIFLLEGLLKWVQPQAAVARFQEIGIPLPELSVLLIGTIEMICASLILANIHVRMASLPLIGIMFGALLMTKIPLLGSLGLIQMVREARLDFLLLLCNLYLFLAHGRDEESNA